MVQSKKCALIQTEASVKEIIRMIGNQENKIVSEIDDFNICTTLEFAETIKEKVANILSRKN